MKRTIIMLLVALVAASSLFATRVSIPYGDGAYMFDTARSLSGDATYYFQGLYDGLTCAIEGRSMRDIHDWLVNVRYPEDATDTDKADYRSGVIDILANHTRDTMGAWDDIYPLYTASLAGATWEDAVTVTVYGEARFFLDLEPMDVVSVTQEKGR